MIVVPVEAVAEAVRFTVVTETRTLSLDPAFVSVFVMLTLGFQESGIVIVQEVVFVPMLVEPL